MNQSFWRCFIQPERRLHIRSTISEMLAISAILYGGVAVFGLISLNLPTWPGIDRVSILSLCAIALAMAITFYTLRNATPLWVVVIHVPLGIAIAGFAIYSAHAPQASILSGIYILAAMYTFHYFTRTTASVITLLAMAGFALALYSNNIVGWQAASVFLTGCCFITGAIVRITVKQLNKLAMHDNLTGLYDRSTIDALVKECISAQGTKGKAKVAMLMLDLNSFKQINDTEGHLKGDEILKTVSDVILDTIGKRDCAARWGGDEFLIVSPTDDENHVKNMIPRLQASLQDTISFEAGTSVYQVGDTLDTMTKRADEAMYSKKRNRRATDIATA
ncbi:MAG: GGDEF domain-containing protein [Gammaproteobacteria bacterium]